MTPEAFLKTFVPLADQVQRETGILAEMALTQAAIESAWGSKAPGNNYFGIRADSSWKGPTVAITTQEEINGKRVTQTKQPFRKYATPLDSFRDYASFLVRNGRYSGAVQTAKTGNASAALAAVAAAGYATASNYGELLQNTLKSVQKRIAAARSAATTSTIVSTFAILFGAAGVYFYFR